MEIKYPEQEIQETVRYCVDGIPKHKDRYETESILSNQFYKYFKKRI